jgi:uncharacterized membrane protein
MQRRMQRKDERGAMIVLAAVGLVVSMIFAGLAVDVGFIAQKARQDQKVADLVALDAVRMLPGTLDQTAAGSVTMAAKASATRNSFAYGTTGYSLLVEWGPAKTGPFTSLPANLAAATAVQITATSPHKNAFPFISGPPSVVRKAVATKKDIAGFTLGSSLVNIDSTSSALLNPIVGKMLGGTVNLSLVSWQGLAAGKVTLAALQTQLAAMGFSVGSMSQLLDADLTLAQLYQATANALAAKGDAADANIFNILKVQALSVTTIKLSKLITVEQGAESSAANADLDLLQLVTGSATVANGSNLVTVPGLTIAVPGVTSTKIALKVLEGPKTYIGTAGAGPHLTTGQIALTITPTLSLDVLSLLRVTGDLPVELHAAGATGTLKSVSCPSKNIVVTADPIAFSGISQSTVLNVKALAGLVPVLDVNTTSLTAPIDGGPTDLSFNYSSDFSPPNQVSKHAGSDPVGLKTATALTGSAASISAVGLLTVGLSSAVVVADVLAALTNVLDNVDTKVLTPLLKAMGMDIGGADVTALGVDPITGLGLPQCGLPSLAS